MSPWPFRPSKVAPLRSRYCPQLVLLSPHRLHQSCFASSPIGDIEVYTPGPSNFLIVFRSPKPPASDMMRFLRSGVASMRLTNSSQLWRSRKDSPWSRHQTLARADRHSNVSPTSVKGPFGSKIPWHRRWEVLLKGPCRRRGIGAFFHEQFDDFRTIFPNGTRERLARWLFI